MDFLQGKFRSIILLLTYVGCLTVSVSSDDSSDINDHSFFLRPAFNFKCPSSDGNFPHEVLCEQYYFCKDGVASLYKCKLDYDLLFNEEFSSCYYSYDTHCGNRTRPDNVSPTLNPPPPTTLRTTTEITTFEPSSSTTSKSETSEQPTSTDNPTSEDFSSTTIENTTSEQPTSTTTENTTSEQPTSTTTENTTSEQPTSTTTENTTSEQPTSTENTTSAQPTPTTTENTTSEQPTSTTTENTTSEQPTSELTTTEVEPSSTISDITTSDQPTSTISDSTELPTTEVPTTTTHDDGYYNCTENGSFPHPKYCEKYFDCWEGVAILQTCPGDFLFDSEKKWCNFNNETNCGDRQRPNCEDGFSYPDPKDCSGFYVCYAGIISHFCCPPPLVYNKYLKVCDYKFNVDCTDRRQS